MHIISVYFSCFCLCILLCLIPSGSKFVLCIEENSVLKMLGDSSPVNKSNLT